MGLYLLFVLVLCLGKGVSGAKIETLPGYDGNLPFSLSTGYIGVDEGVVQLFYYFVEASENAASAPILLWITGGPGSSSLWAFLYENGPLNFDFENYQPGSLPPLIDNEHSWTKDMNMIFLDGPVGTGFSYPTTLEGSYTDDQKFVNNIYEFIRNWLDENPTYADNELYIGGDGYSGNPIPILVSDIVDGNEAGELRHVNIRGYVLGNPGADYNTDFNSRYTYAYKMGFIPDRVYELAVEACDGDLLTPKTDECDVLVAYIKTLVGGINKVHILENACDDVQIPGVPFLTGGRRSLRERYSDFLKLPSHHTKALSADEPTKLCRKYDHDVSQKWVNYEGVKEALGYREGTKPADEWLLYNETVDQVTYAPKVDSVVDYHKKLAGTNIRGIIYSGDHDMDIPNTGTQKWIWTLNLTLNESWRPWYIDNEVVGFVRSFQNDSFSLTYATVKGAGHFAPEYRPRECYQMIHNWTAGISI